MEFAKASALRPRIVGQSLQKIAADGDVLNAMFEILELQKMLEGNAQLTLVPAGSGVLAELLAADRPARPAKE